MGENLDGGFSGGTEVNQYPYLAALSDTEKAVKT
jgi:hypothetical protein